MKPPRLYEYLELSRGYVLGWVRPLSDELYRSEHPVGLGSLARTLHHMRAAEWSYMRRVRGETAPLENADVINDPETSTEGAVGFSELEPAWRELAERTRADLAQVKDWDTPRVYSTVWEGEPYSYEASAADIFAQLAFHEIHHRAQVLQLLRRLGVETGEIDFNTLMWKPVRAG